MTLGASFFHQLNDALRARDELLAIGDFWNDVVVVGIKPLGHLQRCTLGVTASQREFLIEGYLSRIPTDSTDGQSGFEHLVVVRNIRWDGVVLIQAQILQACIGIYSQRMCCGFEGFLVNLACPECLKCLLQLALWPNAWVALNRGLWK